VEKGFIKKEERFGAPCHFGKALCMPKHIRLLLLFPAPFLHPLLQPLSRISSNSIMAFWTAHRRAPIKNIGIPMSIIRKLLKQNPAPDITSPRNNKMPSKVRGSRK